MPRRRQGLVRSGVEHMQDRTDQQRVARVFPMVAPVKRAFGIEQDVGDVFYVANLPFPTPNIEKADARIA
ncbi:hypothetical protein X742_21650 [Mesorhizobium sp. LNHC232B00]|nr:hypothetical protein X742_21650 [Mesorhizobium sp. LNHC232B00]